MAKKRKKPPNNRLAVVDFKKEFVDKRSMAADNIGGIKKISKELVQDSFSNFVARVGIQTDNLSSNSYYSMGPYITRNRLELEAAYRDNWLVGKIVDCIAEDMTREGIAMFSRLQPNRILAMSSRISELNIWKDLCSTIKWARLYGGAMAILLIDGADYSTPLRIEAVGKNTFKGLIVLDRWMVQPDVTNLISNYSRDMGNPEFYSVLGGISVFPSTKIHCSRVLRFDGIELPYYQKLFENLWGLSVVERLLDRLLAFDSATQGAAQLVFKAYLRTIGIEGFREALAMGGEEENAVIKQFSYIQALQSSEGLTVLDSKDTFNTHAYSFAGLSDILKQFGEQISGGEGIPLVRIFGQSPSGFSTGDADIRNYYDEILKRQENDIRPHMDKILNIMSMSMYGELLPEDFEYKFKALWQLSDMEKAQIASTDATTISGCMMNGIFDKVVALKELLEVSRVTGRFTNITDKMIEEAANEPPPQMGGQPPQMGGQPPQMGGQPPQLEQSISPDAKSFSLIKRVLVPKLAKFFSKFSKVVEKFDDSSFQNDAWSKEAREAALEARRKKARLKPKETKKVRTKKLVEFKAVTFNAANVEKLRKSNLKDASFTNCKFEEDLKDFDFSSASFKGCRFKDVSDSKLKGVSFNNCIFDNFSNCILDKAKLVDCKLKDTIRDSSCVGMKISNSVGGDFSFHRSDLSRSKFVSGVGIYSSMHNCKVYKMDLVENGSLTRSQRSKARQISFFDCKYIETVKFIDPDSSGLNSAAYVNLFVKRTAEKNKQAVQWRLSRRAKLPGRFIADLVTQWASTSADFSLESLAIQYLAKEIFNRDEASVNHLNRPKSLESHIESGREGYSKFLKAQYEETQNYFKKYGIKELTFYRGTNQQLEPSITDVQTQPLTSFSIDPMVAYGFGARVMVCKVPVKDILSTVRTGVGCTSEREFVVLGGKMKVSAFKSEDFLQKIKDKEDLEIPLAYDEK